MFPSTIIALRATVVGPTLALPGSASMLDKQCPASKMEMWGSPGKTSAAPFTKNDGDLCKGKPAPPKGMPTVRLHPDYVSAASCGDIMTLMFTPLQTGQFHGTLDTKAVETVAWGKCTACMYRNQIEVDGTLWDQMWTGDGPKQSERTGVWVSWGNRDATKG